MTGSKLLDLNDCNESYKKISEEMLGIALLKNPKWFRYLLKNSILIQQYTGYNHWSRAWEYPWAIEAAMLKNRSRILDVGGGGSPFADYLVGSGHDCYVIDPSLRQGVDLYFDKNKSIYRNLRSFVYRTTLNLLKINAVEGSYSNYKNVSVKYAVQSAQCMAFPENYFDRVFCLSVMEHIPQRDWKKCIQEFERVLKPGGRLIITLDMNINEANNRLYSKLIDYCKLKLVGNPNYEVPIKDEARKRRHRHFYETMGLVWEA